MQESSTETAKRPALIWRVQDAVLNVSAVAMIFGVLAFMTTQIVTRYFFNSPLKWTEEFTRYCAVWLTFIGSVIMVRERASICIDAVTNLLPRKWQKALWLFTTLLCLAFFAIMAYYGYQFVMMNMRIRSLVTGINMAAIYSIIPVSAVLMAINMIRSMWGAPEWKY